MYKKARDKERVNFTFVINQLDKLEDNSAITCRLQSILHFIGYRITAYQQQVEGCTETQRGNHVVLLQCINNFHCAFIVDFIDAQKQKTIRSTQVQCGECIVTLKCNSDFFCTFVADIREQSQNWEKQHLCFHQDAISLPDYKQVVSSILNHSLLIPTNWNAVKNVRRLNVVSVLFLWSAAAISFAPLQAILLWPKNVQINIRDIQRYNEMSEVFLCSAIPISATPSSPISLESINHYKKKIYRETTWLACNSFATLLQALLLLQDQQDCSLLIMKSKLY
eukprot:TRINITY_DN137_c1_g1_i4.p1 TRINITY_DN137_c1_g1~~TRINITY_DN137_c1_g1_i4.p1  ORF type:complete len:308 (+),score=-36.36 TRINITY_DN137_c1_g1_i4:86-925(+)